MAFDLGSARPVAAPRPAAPAQPRDLRPAPAQRQQAASTVSTEVGTARTGQTIAQSAQTFPYELARAKTDAEKAKLELAALNKKLKEGGLDLKEQQALSAARATLMAYGELLYRDAKNKGYDPSSLGNKFSSALSVIPFAGNSLSTQVLDPISLQAKKGKQQFTEGALRTVTGAGGPAGERPETTEQYFPTPWENVNAKTQRGMDELRLAQILGSSRIAGPAVAPQTSALISRLSAPPKKRGASPPPPNLPRVRNDAEYDALPSGKKIQFIDPNGDIRTKP